MRSARSFLLAGLLASCGGSDGGPGVTPVVILSSSNLALTEGVAETLTVALDMAPAADITVNLASLGRATVLPVSFTLTPANFNIPHNVIVTPLQDADLADGTDTITVTATGLPTLHLPVAIADDDSQLVVVTPDSQTIAEGDSGSFAVHLAFQPAGDITVYIEPLDSNLTVSQPTALFTTANWNTPVSVTVSARPDLDVTDEETFVAIATAAGQYGFAYVTVADDDSQAIVVAPDSQAVTEGDTGSFTLRLAFQPAADITVYIEPLDSNLTVSQPTALFTPANWDVPVPVTVTAQQDANLTDEETFVAVATPNTPYAFAYVTIHDDDQQAVQADSSLVNVTEGDSTQFGVRLAYQPAGDYVVNVASLSPADATVAPSTLTFTTANFDAYQQVRVRGTQDNNVAAASTTVRLSGSGVGNHDVPVNVSDDDVQAFVTSVDTVFVTEGLTANITVTLAFQPSSPVTATLSLDTLVATSSLATLASFTGANYATGFTVTITGTEDANTTTDSTLLTIQGPGVPTRNIVVIVADND